MTASATGQRTRHILPGLRPEPLASYLAGLGLMRVVCEQADVAATVAWTPEGLAITTTVGDISAWLASEYVPVPVLSPWNNGSGFGPKDKESRRALKALLTHPSPRLAPIQDAIPLARDVVAKARAEGWITDSGTGGDKRRVVREFRNRCPDALVAWIDATVVLTGPDQAFFPPLLGTGGNDGRLDFSTNYHQRLLEVLGVSKREQARSLTLARDLLAGSETEKLANAAVGQFNPAAAGGPGSSRFGGAESLVNPWGYILLVEGALLFAASAVRRNQHYRQGEERAAMPFTVYASPDGSASGAAGEETRGEIWAPVWTQDFTLGEVRQLFAEARASWRGRPARRAVEFYAATRTLGVARGIGEFTRYGLQRRNGLAFAAVPLDRIAVREKPAVRLAADLEDWASRLGGDDVSSAVGQAKRRFDAAHLRYARDGGALPLARMLAALTSLEQAAGRSGRSREAAHVYRPPSAARFLRVLAEQDPVPPALRIAAGLASCATLPGSDPARGPSRTMRQILLPIDPPAPPERLRSGGHWRDAALVPGFGLRPLPQVLANVLIWRSHTAPAERDQQKFRGVPAFRWGIPVPAPDLHALASGLVEETSLDLWLRACLALDWHGVRWEWPASGPFVPVATLGLLHPLARGLTPRRAGNGTRAIGPATPSEAAGTRDDGEPLLALRPDWPARLAAGQVTAVHREAAARLRQAGWDAVPAAPRAAAEGIWLAAALVPRCRDAAKVMAKLARPLRHGEEESGLPGVSAATADPTPTGLEPALAPIEYESPEPAEPSE